MGVPVSNSIPDFLEFRATKCCFNPTKGKPPLGGVEIYFGNDIIETVLTLI